MFSWDYNFPEMDLETLWFFPRTDFIDFFKKHADSLIRDRFAITSRDNEHVGTSYHLFWCDRLYNMSIREYANVN
jgi:hypothetical protein